MRGMNEPMARSVLKGNSIKIKFYRRGRQIFGPVMYSWRIWFAIGGCQLAVDR